MKYREKLGYIVLGGGLMLVGMLAAGLFAPLGAHNEVKEFDIINCRELRVINSSGGKVVTIGGTQDGGTVVVFGKTPSIQVSGRAGSAFMSISEFGASVSVTGEIGEGSCEMAANNVTGPNVSISKFKEHFPLGGFPLEKYVKLGLGEYGGYVSTGGKGSETPQAVMYVNEYGHGSVSTRDKNGNHLATLK